MGKFTGLNDQEWAIIEPLIPYRWGITQSGTQPLHPKKLVWITQAAGYARSQAA